jgi:transposase InsO family protein
LKGLRAEVVSGSALMKYEKAPVAPLSLPFRAKTIKRNYVAHMPKPDRETALRNLTIAFEHCNEQHPHSALKYPSPREFGRLAAASI